MKELINHEIQVLDHGFIRLVDYMGSDEAICTAARVSYGQGTKSVSDNISLIRYLMRHRHTSPFEMAEMKFHVKVPIDSWRQWIRHRTANVNEYSTRYSIAIDDMQRTNPKEWRKQSKSNKQGSDGYFSEIEGEYFSAKEKELQEKAKEVYLERIEKGMAREQARKDLPLSNYTEAFWKCDLHNILHLLSLRTEKDAQLEIRQYAEAMAFFVKQLFPHTWEAFSRYRLNSVTFSEYEILAIRSILKKNADYEGLSKSEIDEFRDKLRIIGLE